MFHHTIDFCAHYVAPFVTAGMFVLLPHLLHNLSK